MVVKLPSRLSLRDRACVREATHAGSVPVTYSSGTLPAISLMVAVGFVRRAGCTPVLPCVCNGVSSRKRERRKLRHGKRPVGKWAGGHCASVFSGLTTAERLLRGVFSHFANHPPLEPNPTLPLHTHLRSDRSKTKLRVSSGREKKSRLARRRTRVRRSL